MLLQLLSASWFLETLSIKSNVMQSFVHQSTRIAIVSEGVVVHHRNLVRQQAFAVYSVNH
jgi:hypothetical protein